MAMILLRRCCAANLRQRYTYQNAALPQQFSQTTSRLSDAEFPGLLQLFLRRLGGHSKNRIGSRGFRSHAELCLSGNGCKQASGSFEWLVRRIPQRTYWDGARFWHSWGKTTFREYYFHPLWRIISAMSLAVVRSQFTPKLAFLLLGEVTLMHRYVAEAEVPNIPFIYPAEMQPSFLLSTLSGLLSLVEGIALFMRAVYLLLLFVPAIVLSPLADSLNRRWRNLWLELVHKTLERAGAAFIKWGQWAATRPDLFPKDLCEMLSRLHSKAPAHSFVHTRRVVEGAFGRKIEDLFDDFEEEPVASGSIAQVHRAILKAGRKKPIVVAVKVRHPGVTEVIRRDFVLMNWVARLSGRLSGLSYLRLEESVQQFAVFMLTQVDLAREAAHLSRFLYNFRSFKDVSFPRPIYPFVHPAVLVETYERGESVSRYVDHPGRSHINSALAHIGTNTLMKMLLIDNFVHADLHPGNILVRMDPGKPRPGKGLFKSQPHLVLLDVGMTAELSQKDRVTLLDFFKAIATRDGRKAANCTLRFSRLQSCPDPEGFVEDVVRLFEQWKNVEPELLHTGDCIQELLEQVRRHKVNIDGDVCTVMVTTLVLEGWQRKLDPDYNIMGTLQRIVVKPDWTSTLSYTMDSVMAP